MTRSRKLRAGIVSGALLVLLTGCAMKKKVKPVNVQISGCRVTRSYHDEQGNERRDCVCHNGKEIGLDARSRARIFQCE